MLPTEHTGELEDIAFQSIQDMEGLHQERDFCSNKGTRPYSWKAPNEHWLQNRPVDYDVGLYDPIWLLGINY